jgi:hypothetical protein
MGEAPVIGDPPAPEQHDADREHADHAEALPGEIRDDGPGRPGEIADDGARRVEGRIGRVVGGERHPKADSGQTQQQAGQRGEPAADQRHDGRGDQTARFGYGSHPHPFRRCRIILGQRRDHARGG